MSASQDDGKRKSVLRIIESCGPAGASKTTLNNRVTVPARERNEIIEDLLQCQLVTIRHEDTSGRQSTLYVAAKFIQPAISA